MTKQKSTDNVMYQEYRYKQVMVISGYIAGRNDAANPPLLDNGRYISNCLIIQAIVIAMLIAAFLVLVLNFGVMLSIFHSPVNTNSSASNQTISAEKIRTCILETKYCHFLINLPCRTTPHQRTLRYY